MDVVVEEITMEEFDLKRRVSPRCLGKKRPFYGCDSNRKKKIESGSENEVEVEVEVDVEEEERGLSRRVSPRFKGKKKPFYGISQKRVSSLNLREKEECTALMRDPSIKEVKVEVSDSDLGGGGGESGYEKVKNAIMHFNELQVQLGSNVKNGRNGYSCVEQSSKRCDLKALAKMIDNNEILYRTKKFGSLPGIDVGHQFNSRAEVVAVGLHGHLSKDIDYIAKTTNGKLEQYKSYELPLAVSIVMCGITEDEKRRLEEFVYVGEGGIDVAGGNPVRDQVMLHGNLALKNNMEQHVPVRVIRGCKSARSYSGRVYTYDGVYSVISHWAEKGTSGFTVFKYQLKRVDEQHALITNQVHYIQAQASRSLLESHGKVCNDISGGQERIPIPAFNLVDDPPIAPIGYKYCNSIQLGKGLVLPAVGTGCSCKGACTNSKKCACAKLNGSDFPYVDTDGGRLTEAKAVVYECGPHCKCGPNCVNKTSQHGLRYRLEVFRTPDKGWAVRSSDFIPSGAPVCEYTGILTRNRDLDSASGNDFIFEIDCLETMEGLDGRESRPGVVSMLTSRYTDQSDEKKTRNEPEFCIDAGTIGGVARFINHSCDPNLFVQCVLSSHRDAKLARIVLFAADDIPPLQELTYDYGYILDSVIGPDGKVKVMPCYCGAEDCRKRLY